MTGSEQLTTFYIDGELFGIDVLQVQEVSIRPVTFSVPLAPPFVRGLINLRGQIATALGLREIFSKSPIDNDNQMSVLCKIDGNLVSLLVDSIGDVTEVDRSKFESVPKTVPPSVKRFLKGIYKMNNTFLSVLDLDTLAKELAPDPEITSRISH